MWVYIESEPGLYTVGFFGRDGEWQAESDYKDSEEAAARVHWLNGGPAHAVEEACDRLCVVLTEIKMALLDEELEF